MKFTGLMLTALVAVCAIPTPSIAAGGTDCSLVTTAMDYARKLRGLNVKRNVPCRLQNKEQVERYLRDTIREKIPPDRIRNEGIVFKMLGVIPDSFDYVEGLIALYTSQLGGYYDAEKDYYVMADWLPSAMQMPIAVHELTHALQDQHFTLDNLLDQKTENSDTLLARSAVVEGDATAVMMDYSRSLMGQGPLSKEKSVSALMMQNLAGAMLSSSLSSAPSSLQAILVFPYMSGLNFAHAVLLRGGYKEIDKVFRRLPRSTEEILHPELYFNAKPSFVELTQTTLPGEPVDERKPVFADRVGEFVISTLLGSWIGPQRASEAASGWGGDRIVLHETPKRELRWLSHWDTPRDAKEFCSALKDAYAKRFATTATAEDMTFAAGAWGTAAIRCTETDVLLTVS